MQRLGVRLVFALGENSGSELILKDEGLVQMAKDLYSGLSGCGPNRFSTFSNMMKVQEAY